MILFKDQILIRREGKEASKKPEVVIVDTKNCESEWFIRLIDRQSDKPFIMPKGMIGKFYEPAQQGKQGELFGRPETRIDRLKKKHLK